MVLMRATSPVELRWEPAGEKSSWQGSGPGPNLSTAEAGCSSRLRRTAEEILTLILLLFSFTEADDRTSAPAVPLPLRPSRSPLRSYLRR